MRCVANIILLLEPLLLAIVVASLWFPEPYRANTLVLLIPPLAARLLLYRRLWKHIPLSPLFYLFLLLCVVNTAVALADPANPPHSWGWYVVGKPIMGVALALSMISIIYEHARIDGALLVVLLLAVGVGILGLGSSQYTTKSAQLASIIRLLPQIRSFPGAEGGFNVNESGGAMVYFAPFAAGIAIFDWRHRQASIRRAIATLAFLLLTLALFLGQSRLALLGQTISIGALIVLLIPPNRWRYVALAALVAFCGLELVIISQVFQPTATATSYSARNQRSTDLRLEIGGAAATLIREYPLTGYGLNQFRRRDVRNTLVPNYALPFVPHAHNELLQIGVDTGVPGLTLYVAWHLTLGVMIWRTWRKGDALLRAASVSAAAGIAAHAIFGLGDAITLFDRFAFAYWLFVGLAGGAYVLAWERPFSTNGSSVQQDL